MTSGVRDLEFHNNLLEIRFHTIWYSYPHTAIGTDPTKFDQARPRLIRNVEVATYQYGIGGAQTESTSASFKHKLST